MIHTKNPALSDFALFLESIGFRVNNPYETEFAAVMVLESDRSAVRVDFDHDRISLFDEIGHEVKSTDFGDDDEIEKRLSKYVMQAAHMTGNTTEHEMHVMDAFYQPELN